MLKTDSIREFRTTSLCKSLLKLKGKLLSGKLKQCIQYKKSIFNLDFIVIMEMSEGDALATLALCSLILVNLSQPLDFCSSVLSA